jgi:hypothetical protein
LSEILKAAESDLGGVCEALGAKLTVRAPVGEFCNPMKGTRKETVTMEDLV